jgi:methylated-DNA-protein-cysteine methyltransferase-like protein
VYEQVAKVPAGWVATYGDIGKLAGYPRAAREVGLALSRVRPDQQLPCHRIVNASGALAPAPVFGGPDRQRQMLEAEGVSFRANGTIDMKRHRWPPQEDDDQLPLF